MGILDHARRELRSAGYDVHEGEDKLAEVLSDSGDDMNNMMVANVLELLAVFADQGHSGFSAGHCISLFTTLANQKPLGPITGEDHEWNNVTEYNDGRVMYQNNRCSHVFKDANGAWDINGKVFIEPNGCTYTSSDSNVTVEFPYTPSSVRVYVDDNGEVLEDQPQQ